MKKRKKFWCRNFDGLLPILYCEEKKNFVLQGLSCIAIEEEGWQGKGQCVTIQFLYRDCGSWVRLGISIAIQILYCN